MKKKVLALGLAMVMCLSLSMTAFAASSSTGGNSGDQKQEEQKQEEQKPTPAPAKETPKPVKDVVDKTPAGGSVKPEAVKVVVPSADGTAKAVTLDKVVEQKQAEVKQVVASVAAAIAAPTAGGEAQVASAINSILSTPASPMFAATVEALAQMKGSDMVVNNMGSVKTAATAQDALGNTIASAGVIKNVTPGALVMLMSINADGTIEYVEGIVDPLTGSVIGAFKGVPAVITVMVLA